jgi:AcrR family transcriptional regulator
MTRWQPNAPGRLAQAALDLFLERGYTDTTVAEIAQRAGVTERTFFRHFSDKREVLFWGPEALRETLVNAIAATPAAATPLEAVTVGLEAVAAVFHGRHAYARQRQAVIAANPELQEREFAKLGFLAAAMTDALRGRGVNEPAASLAAEVGVLAFKTAFARWVANPVEQDPRLVIQQVLSELKAVTAGGGLPLPQPPPR